MNVQPAVLALALHPFRELPTYPGVERIAQDGILLDLSPYPSAQIVEPLDLGPAEVPAAVAATRAIARDRGKRILAWWISSEHAHLVPALEDEGIVNADTPGFEAIENAMVLVDAPSAGFDPAIAVSEVGCYDDFVAAMYVLMEAFAIPDDMRAEAVREFPKRWDEYTMPGNPGRQYVAKIGDEVVGTAGAALGNAGINLFGGSVAEHARGRGVYRALIAARWDEAVRHGSPALTVQAGKMSMPILAKLGFAPVGKVRVYVDEVDRDGG
jgi:GNAT superfamily N-acetyltransferase